jgi:thermitase
MTTHSKHLGRQLLVMAAVLLGTMLLVGLLPPQEAQGKEQIAAPPAQGTGEAQEQERVLDKDPQGNEYVAGELLVTYKEGASKQAKEEAPKKVGAKVEKDFPTIDVQHLSVPEVKNERSREARQQALERDKKDLEQDPDVEAVDYNYVREGTVTPTDPDYCKQWSLPKINAPQAWDSTQGSSSVKVAILDSGIDRNHPDLKKVVSQYDYVNWDADATDDQGHGTLTAGIAAASMNNGKYGAGTCPKCSLLVAKSFRQ